jgi:hypothetical protein
VEEIKEKDMPISEVYNEDMRCFILGWRSSYFPCSNMVL